VTTIACSSLLRALVAAAGVAYRETLPGFKWLMRAAAQAAPLRLLFAYDEALGYAVNDVVRDKDGISAALVLRQAASQARGRGQTLADVLDAIAVRHGLHATRHVAIEVPDDGAGVRAAMMSALRADPPRSLGGRPVTEMIDHLTGAPPRADALVWRCGKELRVVARPSGSEPTLKLYLELVMAVREGRVGAGREQAAEQLAQLATELKERLASVAG
jgi:phosphomannomutase